MMALQLLKDKLGTLEQNVPYMEERLKDYIEKRNKKSSELHLSNDILKLDENDLKKARHLIDLQLHAINQNEALQTNNEQIRDYQQAIERLEVES